MTEKQFIEKNKQDWERLETMIANQETDADQLHKLFLKISGDLSYAQTYFPRRTIRWYLDSLLGNIYNSMRTNIKVDFFQTISKFYTYTLPSEIIRNKNAFLASFLILIIASLIGIYSTIQDPDYPRQILGDDYIEMTERNIKKGDPMAVYKSGGRVESYLHITNNNIRVALNTYVLGLLGGIGTVFILIKNGVMLGAFQTFFYNKNLLLNSALSIWIHGTIEIISIIIAGAAGLIIGRHLLFPQSYSRIQSLMLGGVRSLIVMLSTFPLFIIAGFFEGFLTPITNLPSYVKFMIIIASLLFMILIYIVQPIRMYYSGLYNKYDLPLQFLSATENQIENIEDNNYIKKTVTFFRHHLGIFFNYLILPFALLYTVYFYNFIPLENATFNNNIIIKPLSLQNNHALLILETLYTFYFMAFMKSIFKIENGSLFSTIRDNVKKHFGILSIATIIVILVRYISPFIYFENIFYILFPYSILTFMTYYANQSDPDISVIKLSFVNNFTFWLPVMLNSLLIGLTLFAFIGTTLLIQYFFTDFLQWHLIDSEPSESNLIVSQCINQFNTIVMNILMFLMYHYNLEAILTRKYSYDLQYKIENFINKSKL